MRKGVMVLLLGLSCSFALSGCGDHVQSGVKEHEVVSEKKESNGIKESESAEQASSDESKLEDAKEEDETTSKKEKKHWINVETISQFDEFLKQQKERVNDTQTYDALIDDLDKTLEGIVGRFSDMGLNINVNEDIYPDYRKDGVIFLTFKHIKTYNDHLNDAYYAGKWSDEVNIFLTVNNWLDLIQDKINVLNNQRRDIDGTDLVNNSEM